MLPRVNASVTLHIKGGDRVVKGPLRATRTERSVGLMYRKKRLSPDEGMLFMMDGDADHSFWMRNTLIPLDMVFIDRDGTVVGMLEDVAPKTDIGRSVGKPSRFVLELDGGWCRRFGLKPGDRVDFEITAATGR